jgi:hypothetical protein
VFRFIERRTANVRTNAETTMDESSALFAGIIERGMEYEARLVDYDTARDSGAGFFQTQIASDDGH